MSDKKEHTMQGGVDWELRSAEDRLVAAPGGGKELAQAMRLHADGVRNMMQSELVPSFEKAIDGISEKHTVRILTEVALRLDEISSYVQRGITIANAAHKTGKEALAIAKSNAAQMVTLKKAVATLEKGQKESEKQWKEVLKLLADSRTDRADLRSRIDSISAIVEEHNRVSVEHAALVLEVAELKERIDKLEHGGG